jgi:pimeloyl-ACP methyl ester carboxylesterase
MELADYHPFRSAKAKEEYLAFYDRKAELWPVESESRMVETSFGQTFVRISGPRDAQPLVLLCGIGDTSLMWSHNVEALSTGFRTYAVDHINDNGRSVYTRLLNTPGDYVQWLDELFSALALGDHIHLMGMSLGGWQAALYTLRYPNRIAKTVLLAPALTVLPIRLEVIFRMILTVFHPRLMKRLQYWWCEDGVRKDEATRKAVDEDADADALILASKCYKSWKTPPLTVLSDLELQRLQKTPTLYLVGEHEKIYSAQKAVQRLNKVAPRIQTDIIPRAGHDLFFVQAEMVNRKVVEFLKQSRPD